MKRGNILKAAGFVVAAWLIIFGSMGNFLRTVKFGLDKLSQKD